MSFGVAAGNTAVAANGMAAGGMAAAHARSSGPMGSGPMGSGPMGSGPMGSGPSLDMLASLSSIPPDPLAGMLPSYHPLVTSRVHMLLVTP